jgi:hypothetical protein
MLKSLIQFQKGYSLPDFFLDYGTEGQFLVVQHTALN